MDAVCNDDIILQDVTPIGFSKWSLWEAQPAIAPRDVRLEGPPTLCFRCTWLPVRSRHDNAN